MHEISSETDPTSDDTTDPTDPTVVIAGYPILGFNLGMALTISVLLILTVFNFKKSGSIKNSRFLEKT